MTTENTKKYTHGAYSIRQYKVGEETRSEWVKIGCARAHKGGTGFNIKLNLMPLDGEITLYPFAAKKERARGE